MPSGIIQIRCLIQTRSNEFGKIGELIRLLHLQRFETQLVARGACIIEPRSPENHMLSVISQVPPSL
jgi:hypothetical protein